MKWAVGQMKVRGYSLNKMISNLKSAKGDIFESMFSSAWKMLTREEKQVIFCMLNYVSTVPKQSLEAASGLSNDIFNDALGKLIWLSLIDTNGELTDERQMLSMHSLTKSFVYRELQQNSSNGGFNKNLTSLRIANYYLDFVIKNALSGDIQNGYDRIEVELQNIMKIIEDISSLAEINHDITYDNIIIQMGNALSVFLWSRGFWNYRIKVGEQVIKSANRQCDWKSVGRHAYFIGIVYFWQGNYNESKKWHSLSRDNREMTGSIFDIALSNRLEALIDVGDEAFDKALLLFEDVLKTISADAIATNKDEIAVFADWVVRGENGYKAGVVSILQEIGITYNREKEFEKAYKWLNDSLRLAIEIGDIEGQAVSYSHIGHALFGLQQILKAKRAYRRGYSLAQRVQRKSTIARCSQGLANVYKRMWQNRKAMKYGADALDLFERLGMREEYDEVKLILEHPSKIIK